MAPSTDGEDKATKNGFMGLVSFIMKHTSWSWDEVLMQPLIRLNSIRKELLESGNADLIPALHEDGVDSAEDNLFNGRPMDEMSRDDYFDWVNAHS